MDPPTGPLAFEELTTARVSTTVLKRYGVSGESLPFGLGTGDSR